MALRNLGPRGRAGAKRLRHCNRRFDLLLRRLAAARICNPGPSSRPGPNAPPGVWSACGPCGYWPGCPAHHHGRTHTISPPHTPQAGFLSSYLISGHAPSKQHTFEQHQAAMEQQHALPVWSGGVADLSSCILCPARTLLVAAAAAPLHSPPQPRPHTRSSPAGRPSSAHSIHHPTTYTGKASRTPTCACMETTTTVRA